MTRPFEPFRSDAELAAVAEGVRARTLPKAAWTHAAHFAAAFWIVARCPDLDAERDMPGIIRAYNEATGVANTDTTGYHHTITLASLAAVRAHLLESPLATLSEACNALLLGPYGDPGWLLDFWSRGAVFSVAARRGWLAPDLRPLPFEVRKGLFS